jgi:hypothetical protein
MYMQLCTHVSVQIRCPQQDAALPQQGYATRRPPPPTTTPLNNEATSDAVAVNPHLLLGAFGFRRSSKTGFNSISVV